MQAENTTDWWMWQMYRRIAEIIHQPSPTTEEHLRVLIAQYRNHWERQQIADRVDPHEHAMDYI